MNSPRIFCIGRNYSEHAKELGNEAPKKPVVFLKPYSCLVPKGQTSKYPKHGNDLHHEVELVYRIGKAGVPQTIEEALTFIDAYTLGIDLTLRDVQEELKNKGLPWEMSKAFEQSALIGDFKSYNETDDLENISFKCLINGEVRQSGNSGDMIFSIGSLLLALGKIWTFQPNDLIYTGTPAGVSALKIGDKITAESEGIGSFSWEIVE